jgi:hypothetical protein
MTKETYAKIIEALDNFSKVVKECVPEEYIHDKHEMYTKIRELSHWLRDVYEVELMKTADEVTMQKYREHQTMKAEGKNVRDPVLIKPN